MPPMKIELRCRARHDFKNTTTQILAGPYLLRILPKASGGTTEALLLYEDDRISRTGHSDPEEEGRIILDIISLLTGAAWSVSGLRINDVDVGIQAKPIDPVGHRSGGELNHNADMRDALSFGGNVLTQFIRSCHAFSLALQAGATDVALGFLLLVTSIECLSGLEEFIPNSELNKDKKSAERYVKFVQTFCHNKRDFYGEKDEQAFIKNLKTVYYVHRSGFVHAGREVSVSASIADRLGVPMLTHYIDGQETHTPGLQWFARVVRSTLIGFMKDGPKEGSGDRDALQALAATRAVLTMRMA